MIPQSTFPNPDQMNLRYYLPPLEEVQETEIESNKTIEKRKKLNTEKNLEWKLLNRSHLPEEIISEIFLYIQDISTKISIIETCHQFCEIGARIFKIKDIDEDGSFPVAENLMKSRENGAPVLFKLLQEISINPRYQERVILPWAIRYRHIKIKRLIITNPDFNPIASLKRIFNVACHHGELETIQVLLGHQQLKNKIDSQISDQSFLDACKFGQAEVVKLLLKDQTFNLSDKIEFGFLVACENGHTDVVNALLEAVFVRNDKLVLIEKAIVVARENNCLETITLILNRLKEFEQVSNDKSGIKISVFKSFYDKMRYVHSVNEINSKHYPSNIELLMKEKGREGILKLLANNGTSKTYIKYVILPWASRKGIVDIVNLILEEAGVVRRGQDNEWTSKALLEASRFGYIKVVQALLAKTPKDSPVINKAMQMAIENGYSEIVEFLFKNYPKENFTATISNLCKASENGHTEVVKLLLENTCIDALPMFMFQLSEQKDEAIIKASQNGHIEVVKLLLSDDRIDPSAQNNVAIIMASLKGLLEVVKLLLSHRKVDPSARKNESIIVASQNGHTEVVKVLLSDQRVDASAQENESIIVASQNGHTELVKLLLSDQRVDASAQENEAILQASQNGHTELVKLLLSDQRVDASAQENEAILQASQNGHIEVVNLLLMNNKVNAYPLY